MLFPALAAATKLMAELSDLSTWMIKFVKMIRAENTKILHELKQGRGTTPNRNASFHLSNAKSQLDELMDEVNDETPNHPTNPHRLAGTDGSALRRPTRRRRKTADRATRVESFVVKNFSLPIALVADIGVGGIVSDRRPLQATGETTAKYSSRLRDR